MKARRPGGLASTSGRSLAWASAAWLSSGCGAGPAVEEGAAPAFSETERARVLAMSPVPAPPPDPSNAVADDPRAAAFGRALFFDPGLGGDGRVACSTCHVPESGWTDGLPKARGIGEAARNTPSVSGAAASPWLFWDGRADSLWSQALGPIESPVEMGSSRARVAHRVAEAWREPYEGLFGPLPDLGDVPRDARPDPDDPAAPHAVAWGALDEASREAVDRVFAQVGKALAAFERRLLPGESPLDRYVAAVRAGDPAGGGHLSPAAVRGAALFVGEAGCWFCHHGPLLTDHAFHNLGLPPPGPGRIDVGRTLGAKKVKDDPFNCAGRFSDTAECPELRYLDPAFEDFLGAFRTPSLRNVAKTAPYMHSGQVGTLAEVLGFYNDLPGIPMLGHRELTLRPLHLRPDRLADLEAFLRALSDDGPAVSLASLPPAPSPARPEQR